MGKLRAFFSMLYNGFFYFGLPSLLFFWVTISTHLPDFPIQITLLNYYLPELIIELYRFPFGSRTLPIGLRITVTSVLGLAVTFFGVLGCMLQDIFTIGAAKFKQSKFIGFIKNLIAMGWVWFGFHQFSSFIVDLNEFQSTLLLQLQLYLVAGILVSFFTAIANLLQATNVEESPQAKRGDKDTNKRDDIVLGKK